MLLEEVGKRFVSQFLKRRHAVSAELGQLIECVFVKADQFPHGVRPSVVDQAVRLEFVPTTGTGECGLRFLRNGEHSWLTHRNLSLAQPRSC